ncbi:hypothetical protein M433DRAFT_376752 [Acidomyces richmondensis BFW]|nr:MAG: hypothetical protein FE78DRAFT_287547 [Acidomyces sp. 'richmondensis']KYG48854.1 hypothetical protein M433DRAFT_376752 [Acidomyces richmondensis BFW]
MWIGYNHGDSRGGGQNVEQYIYLSRSPSTPLDLRDTFPSECLHVVDGRSERSSDIFPLTFNPPQSRFFAPRPSVSLKMLCASPTCLRSLTSRCFNSLPNPWVFIFNFIARAARLRLALRSSDSVCLPTRANPWDECESAIAQPPLLLRATEPASASTPRPGELIGV